jgi:hypothetical protein
MARYIELGSCLMADVFPELACETFFGALSLWKCTDPPKTLSS